MQKIMFEHRIFGLEQAVIDRLKGMTRRTAKLPDGLEPSDVWNPVMGIDSKGRVYFTADCIDGKQRDLYPRYQIGEEVAVAQSYLDIKGRKKLFDPKDWWEIEAAHNKPMHAIKGVDNKMYVKADLMPHRIKITNIKLERSLSASV